MPSNTIKAKEDVSEILKKINNLVGYRDFDKNLMKDLVEESYNLGYKHGFKDGR